MWLRGQNYNKETETFYVKECEIKYCAHTKRIKIGYVYLYIIKIGKQEMLQVTKSNSLHWQRKL